MYNLIIGGTGDRMDAGRMFEYTEKTLLAIVDRDDRRDYSRLLSLPTLLMPEVGGDTTQEARLGRVEAIRQSGKTVTFRFVPNLDVAPIDLDIVQAQKDALEISDWEFTRTHWALKDADPYWILQTTNNEAQESSPTALRRPKTPRENDLIAVMMPFSSTFDAAYETIQDAAEATVFQSVRVDEIWENPGIMDDVASLLHRSAFVLSDLSGKNPNVFYETGIAHAWEKEVVMITRSAEDVPFDLRHLRFLTYLPNSQGLEVLGSSLRKRFKQIRALQSN